jgi:uncharacterized membrane protein SirB2
VDYGLVKSVHVTCAVLSGLGFAARGFGMMFEAAWVRSRWARVLPHVVDTVLLASAVALAAMLAQYPFVHAWLTAKVLALLLYILLGLLALRPGRRSRATRLAAWLGALAVFAYIVAVATTRNPLVIG